MKRFWDKVNKTEACWLWTAANAAGYGLIKLGGRMQKAHRVSWEMANGVIPPGMCVCHHCDVPLCVNPAHLFLGTVHDNQMDMRNKGRFPSQRGEGNHAAKLTKKSVISIRQEYATGACTLAHLADKHAVTLGNISAVILRKSWAHV